MIRPSNASGIFRRAAFAAAMGGLAFAGLTTAAPSAKADPVSAVETPKPTELATSPYPGVVACLKKYGRDTDEGLFCAEREWSIAKRQEYLAAIERAKAAEHGIACNDFLLGRIKSLATAEERNAEREKIFTEAGGRENLKNGEIPCRVAEKLYGFKLGASAGRPQASLP